MAFNPQQYLSDILADFYERNNLEPPPLDLDIRDCGVEVIEFEALGSTMLMIKHEEFGDE